LHEFDDNIADCCHNCSEHNNRNCPVSGNGVGTNYGVGVGEARPERAESGDGVLGEGTASPSPPARVFVGVL